MIALFPPFIDTPIEDRRTLCVECGASHCDSCRIFGDRVSENEKVDRIMNTHAWRCYGHKQLRIGGVTVKRRYYKCTRCKSFGIPRHMCKDTYPNEKTRWHPVNGSVLAPCCIE